MGIVDFNTCIWKDTWFRRLPLSAKNLFIYFWTNDHKNLTCIYEIDFETISFYTGLTKKQIESSLEVLYPKIKYDKENQLVWVVKYVRHQFMRTKNTSDKIKTGIVNILTQNNGHIFVKEFLEEYQDLDLDYKYTNDRVSGGYLYSPGGGEGKGKGIIKSKDNTRFKTPSVEDVVKFFTDNGYTEESAVHAFNYYNDAEPPWTDSRGKKVRGWKQKMRGVWFKPENKISNQESEYI